MKLSYPVEQVAAVHLPEMKDGVRWLKRRIVSGEIPGWRPSRSVFRMTDADIDALLEYRRERGTAVPEPVEAVEQDDVSLASGLSARSQRRLRRAS